MTTTVERMLEDAQDLLSVARSDTRVHYHPVNMARALAAVAAGLQFQEQLVLARESRRVQDQQLELQRQVGFPGLAGCVELVERIAATEDGGWDARTVNDWIAAARGLDTP